MSHVAFSDLVIRANNPALTGSQILSTILNPTSPECLTRVVYYQGAAQIDEFEDVTIDGRFDPSGGETAQAATAVFADIFAASMSITNCTIYGLGVDYGNYSRDNSFDNDMFYASGANASQAGAISLGADDRMASVTRCVVQAAVDDRDVQTGNSDYDSANRLVWAGESQGFLYVGGNTSRELYPDQEANQGGLNGGEQVLVEPIQPSHQSDGAISVGGKTPVGVASDLGITSFGVDSFAVADAGYPLSDINGGSDPNNTNFVGEQTISILSGPGAGQVRYIPSSPSQGQGTNFRTYTPGRPWNVVPTAASVVSIGNVPVDVAVYGNSLNGDGLRSTLPGSAACGTQVPGTNVSIDDNDVSGVRYGLDVQGDQTLDVNMFNLYADNSLHGEGETGVRLASAWDGVYSYVPAADATPVAAATAGMVGPVFRDDSVGGTGYGFEVGGNLVAAPTGATAVMGLPVFDRCVVVGAGLAFKFQNTAVAGQSPGIAFATLVDCRATGDGTVGTAAVTRAGTYIEPSPGTYDDPDPDLIAFDPLGTDQWQGFDYDYQGPPRS